MVGRPKQGSKLLLGLVAAPAPAPLAAAPPLAGGVGTKLQQLRLARWGHGVKISGHGRKNIWTFDIFPAAS